ncbi:helix-turn-helix transcriptional regulator [Mycoplasmatota bacterium zrk1]
MREVLFKKYISSSENAKLLGTLIRINRIEQNISVEALANYAKIARSYLSQVERGVRSASGKKYASIFEQLDIDFKVIDNDLMTQRFENILEAINYVDNDKAKLLIDELENSKVHFAHSTGIVEYYLIRFIFYVITQKGTWSPEIDELENKLLRIRENLSQNYKILLSQYRGVRKYYDKEFDEALTLLHRANDYGISKHTPMINYHIGLVYTVYNKPVPAILACLKSKSYFEKEMNYKRSIATRMHLGINYSLVGDYQLAEDNYNDIIQISKKLDFPNYLPTAYINLAYLHLRYRNFDMVYKYLELGRKLDPNHWDFIYCGILTSSKAKDNEALSKWIKLGKDDKFSDVKPLRYFIELFESLHSETNVDIKGLYEKTIESIKENFNYIEYEAIVLMYIEFLESNRMYKEALNYQQKLFWTMKGKRDD